MSRRVLRVILVPDASESRTYEIGYKRLRLLRGLGIGLGVVLLFFVVTWGYMALSTGYGLTYIVTLLVAAVFIFSRRDFK